MCGGTPPSEDVSDYDEWPPFEQWTTTWPWDEREDFEYDDSPDYEDGDSGVIMFLLSIAFVIGTIIMALYVIVTFVTSLVDYRETPEL